MSPYDLDIVQSSGCDPEYVRCVEHVMRDNNGGILGELTRAKFNREARKAWKYVESLVEVAKDPDSYLKELKMTRPEVDDLIRWYLTEPRVGATACGGA